MILEIEHRMRCVKLAKLIAMEKDPIIKEMLWRKFKQL